MSFSKRGQFFFISPLSQNVPISGENSVVSSHGTKDIKNGQLLFLLLCTAVQISEQAIVRKAKTNKFHRSSDNNEPIFLSIFRKILTRLVAIFPKGNYFIESKVKTSYYEVKLEIKGKIYLLGCRKWRNFKFLFNKI